MTQAHAFAARGCMVRSALIIAATTAALGLAGCETGPLGSIGQSLEGLDPKVAQAPKNLPPLALGPIAGAPANVTSELAGLLTASIQKAQLPLAQTAEQPHDYVVKGFLVATAEKTDNTKLVYEWHVVNKAGAIVHKILGERLVPGKNKQNVWAVVSKDALTGVADITATKLATFLPVHETFKPIEQPVAQAPAAGGRTDVGPVGNLTQGVKAQPVLAMIPAVAGAPGDGQAALTNAIQAELGRRGVKLAAGGQKGSHTVQGIVQMGAPVDGKQAIKIEWQVLDGNGRRIGTVSQSNTIPQGSLDGKWGKTAELAAAAAAEGIIRLLPKR